ncbi:M12 family metallo-peptidase [Aliikangiella maris]|uniref:M12 family metallo-peptidase n=2 Tax=Aliikangiella maris TaxID=3162458 RepID=A0ABV3MQR6_9GAMM
MKNKLIKRFWFGLTAIGAVVSSMNAIADNKTNALQQRIDSMKANGTSFTTYHMFNGISNTEQAARALSKDLDRRTTAGAKFFKLDNRSLKRLQHNPEDAITLTIPYNESGLTSSSSSIKVNLFRREIYSKNAKFFMSENQESTPIQLDAKSMDLGVHYQGVIEGEENSIVALSFYKDAIEGRLHSHQVGDINIGKLKDKTGSLSQSGNKLAGAHVMYRVNSLDHKKPEHRCGSDISKLLPNFDHESMKAASMLNSKSSLTSTEPAADGKVPNALNDYYFTVYTVLSGYLVSDVGESYLTNWVGSVLNQVAAVYNVDYMYMYSEGWTWYRDSPVYDSRLGTDLMQQFAYYDGKNTINSDVGMLLTSSRYSSSSSYGLAHKIGGVCSYETIDGLAYSPVWSTYNYFPTYSWTVDVYAHEAGHTLGSAHTHACAWWGNNTAIDGCARPEGSCYWPAYPANGQGTVMSYCANNVGKNPGLGFHSQVASRLQSYILGCADR